MDKNKIIENMKKTILEICENIGPRPPCSIQETKCAEYIKDNLKNYSDEVNIEEFSCHPDAYKIIMRLPMISIVIFTIIHWAYLFNASLLFTIIMLIIVSIISLIIYYSLTLNLEIIDPIFREKKSTNVFAKILPKNGNDKHNSDIKEHNIILIGGHHDSNFEFKLIRISPKLFSFVITSSIISGYLFLVIYIINLFLIYNTNLNFIFIILNYIFLIGFSILMPLYLYSAIIILSNDAVLGANDNLTSIAIIIEIAKYFFIQKSLKNTELWLVSHGCEEIGVRGSKRFSKLHKNELKNALIINIDMIGDKNSNLKIDIKEEVSVIKLYKDLGFAISQLASKMNIDHTIGNIDAYTDSMAYSQNGLKACSLIGLPKKGLPLYYHTKEDTPDKLDFNKLYLVFELLIEFIKKYDKREIEI